MPITIYGIKTCDTMKKAWTWLDSHGHAYRFHDYRTDGLDAATLKRWIAEVGWEKLLNKASTSFKDLPEADKAALTAKTATALMLKNPTMIKRPVLDLDGTLTVGFRPEIYEKALAR